MGPDYYHAAATSTRPFLITFSGIDGAGKTTQIESLSSYLQAQGLRVLRLSFWDNVAVWSKMRSKAGYRSVESCGTAVAPSEISLTPKNNKHIRKWYLTAARSGFYLLDVARLRWLVHTEHIKNFDVVIFDRYIYDQIANIYSRSLIARFYSKLLLHCAPVPDLAFILDASPLEAFIRKPEYPLEFTYRNRKSFLSLRALAPQLITIRKGDTEEVRNEIFTHLIRSGIVEIKQPRANHRSLRHESRSPAAELL